MSCVIASECKRTADGSDYNGRQNVTRSGASCIPWMTEQLQAFAGEIRQDVVPSMTDNYCRNYKFDEALDAPWCFTSTSSWDYCHIKTCGERKLVLYCISLLESKDVIWL